MRCLYCGKELALLKRWTRGGQFCSEAHKKSYQEEYNRIGLNRLLQAQSKPKAVQQEASPALNGGSKTPPRPVHEAPVAVEEAPVELVEEVQRVEEIAEQAAEEDTVEALAGSEAAEVVDERVADEPEEVAWEPESMAGFINDSAAEPAAMEAAPFSHSWRPGDVSPARPSWQPAGVLMGHLPEAAVLELKFRPNLAESEHSAPEVKLTPHEFEPGKPFPPSLAMAASSNQIPSAGVVSLEMKPSVMEWRPLEPAVTTLTFPLKEIELDWSLLQLRSTEVDFPGADAPVFFEGESADGALWEAASNAPAAETEESGIAPGLERDGLQFEPSEEAHEPVEEPVAATEGLAQLSESLTEKHTEPEAVDHDEPAHVAEAEEPLQASPEDEPAVEAQAPAALEHSAPAEAESGATSLTEAPRSADQAVEIPIKIFTPGKPNPVEGAGALVKLPVFLPGHTGLPLRPKMGLVPASGTPGKKTGQRPAKAQPQAESKAVEVKPESTPGVDAKGASEAAKGASTPSAKPWGKPTTLPAPKDAPGAAKKPVVTPKVQQAPSVKITPPAAKAREEEKPKQAAAAEKDAAENAAAEKTATAKSTPEKDAVEKAASEKAVEKTVEKTPAPKPAVEPQAAAAEIEVPSFGAAQSGNGSFLSTPKGKMAIGGVAVVLCLGAYFIFGGKPAPAPNPAAAAATADKAGPSIMVGSGGWVEGWAGDPAGEHLRRQITIYRPSLKLSDYRMEFTGEIEHKSLGWVFRAADPDNYYIMKLAYTTPGLEPKIGLLKSVVINGKETQVGKTPINMSVRLDTQYSIRMDARGSKFTTYVQGQLVDTWNDDQLKAGGVGFLNEREERGRVKSVSVSLLNGGKQ